VSIFKKLPKQIIVDFFVRLEFYPLLLLLLLPRYNWNIVESGVKHHKPKPIIFYYYYYFLFYLFR